MQNRIRYFRKQRGLTLEALGAAIGLTPQSLSRIENGKMRLSTEWLARIAAALRLSPLDLIDGAPLLGAELIGEIGLEGVCQNLPPQIFRLAAPGAENRVVRLARACGPYREGEYLICARLDPAHTDQGLGRDCLVEFPGGQRRLCRLAARGKAALGNPPLFTLAGLDSPGWVLENQAISWAAPVHMRLQFIA